LKRKTKLKSMATTSVGNK